MLAAQNILNPKDGKPVVTPSQDMVLVTITLLRKRCSKYGAIFNNTNEVLKHMQMALYIYTRIGVHASSFNNQHLLKNKTKILATQ